MYRKSVTTSASNNPSKPTLSLILCSRNDQYMGNSRWRLQTTLNYVAQMAHEISREEDVEVLVADWGSEIPLREILELSPLAARMVSFILIPPEIARDLQKDSPFAEVLALNAAARRSSGEYIGRIDQDTLVGKRFLEYFFELYEGKQQLYVPLNSALLFANRRSIPYWFAVRCPTLGQVDKFIRVFGQFLKVWKQNRFTQDIFWTSYVGIWLLHRDLWDACEGYDESLIYYNWMETDMVMRLIQNRQVIDLGEILAYDFYHLEHYNPIVNGSARVHDMKNRNMDVSNLPKVLKPNGSDWGLVQYHFKKLPYSFERNKVEEATSYRPAFKWSSFLLLLVSTGAQIVWDEILRVKSFRPVVYVVWKRRTQSAWKMVHHQPLVRWPRLLVSLWVQKKRNQKQEKQEYLR
jgi:hypothetical protein